MKSRLLRALTVGAALLIPLSGLTLLSAGTAGATIQHTTACLVPHTPPSTVSVIVTIKLAPKCTTVKKTTTHHTWANKSGHRFVDTGTGPGTLHVVITSKIKGTYTTTPWSITTWVFESGATMTLSGTYIFNYTGCVITIANPITFKGTMDTLTNSGSADNLTGSTVTGCTTGTATMLIHDAITAGTAITGTLYVG